MAYYRHIYSKAPHRVEVPEDLRNRRIEVIILPLDEPAPEGQTQSSDSYWPEGFIEATAGKWAGEPLVREQPMDYEESSDLP